MLWVGASSEVGTAATVREVPLEAGPPRLKSHTRRQPPIALLSMHGVNVCVYLCCK